jgi:hypothetical protein
MSICLEASKPCYAAATLQGAAVKAGVLCARGELVLFADADGATVITGVEALEQRLNEAARKGRGLAVGSRAHMQQEVTLHAYAALHISVLGLRYVRRVAPVHNMITSPELPLNPRICLRRRRTGDTRCATS